MKKIGTAFILILLLSCIIVTPVAYAKKGQVTVRVTRVDENGKRSKAVDTEVVLKIGDESVGVDTTDDKGKVVFTGLKANTEYTLVVVGSDGFHYTQTFTTNRNGGAPQQNMIVR